MTASDGSTGIKVTDDDISITSGQSGNIYLTVPAQTDDISTGYSSTDEIAFGFSSSTTHTDGSGTSYNAYDVRLQHSDSTGTSLISNVPVRLTVVDYSSDVRIKRKITDANTDELLQRLQQVEYKRYRYTEAWQDVRGIEDVEVRGVIAQQLHEVTSHGFSIRRASIHATCFIASLQ